MRYHGRGVIRKGNEPQVNPVIIIPTYWAETDYMGGIGERGTYDYVTPIARPLPELETCLASLEKVRGVLRVMVLVVSEKDMAESARARVDGICRAHPNLNTLVVGRGEAALVRKAVASIAPTLDGENVSLRGYGAIKNMGLAVAALLGHDVAVFLDDDLVATDANFLANAVHGLGTLTRNEQRIIAKTGYFLNGEGSPFSGGSGPVRWSERLWSKRDGFNDMMREKLRSERISRSNWLCGGCCALHASAFSQVPFDPYIPRGEDLDYVVNLRARGIDAWFDNAWSVRAVPPALPSRASLLMQDTYRWLYELEKLDTFNRRKDMRTVTVSSLKPYPAPWFSPDVRRRIVHTAARRLFVGPERGAYLRILTKGIAEAEAWAAASKERYLAFLNVWPTVVDTLWEERGLAARILETGNPQRSKPVSAGDLRRLKTEAGR